MTRNRVRTSEFCGKRSNPIPVTKPYFPPIEKYTRIIESVYDNGWLTNGGPVLDKLTNLLKEKFNTDYLLIVNNGTSALQIAYKIFNLENKNVITSPYTFPATATALEWIGANVIHADICPKTWNLDPKSVRSIIKSQSIDAVVPVNIFGNPCNLDAFERIGSDFDIPIIYDSAQALLSQYKGQSIFNYGDVHCVSFHATKLFHTVEGGALIFKRKQDFQLAKKLINFGIEPNGEVNIPGTNAKLSELHAAMGICVLEDLESLVDSRAKSVEIYRQFLPASITLQKSDKGNEVPPMYMPVLFPSESELLAAAELLEQNNILSRRYFYPRNHKFLMQQTKCSERLIHCDAVSNRILCLPLMHDMKTDDIKRICSLIQEVTKS